MNKLLQKLTDQCRTEHRDGGYTEQFDEEKFAELIIQECIGVIHKEHDEGIDRHGDYQLAVYEVYREIKEHFGVE